MILFLDHGQMRILQMKHDMRSGFTAGRAQRQGKFWTIVDVESVAASHPPKKGREDEAQQSQAQSSRTNRTTKTRLGPKSRTKYPCPPSEVLQARQPPHPLSGKSPRTVCPWTNNGAVVVSTQDIRGPARERSPKLLGEGLRFRQDVINHSFGVSLKNLKVLCVERLRIFYQAV